jgi:alpha-glucosidase
VKRFNKPVSILLLMIGLCLVNGPAQPKRDPLNTKPDANGHAWWQHAVIYEIYPRSFADTNGDGIGDLNGITAHLDHLKTLGINALWIAPCFPSPQVDFGYDVSDYENIAPEYGTLKDFDHLQSEAQKRGIRIILDYVINHTSDQHEWFKQSASSQTNPKRDWYIWRGGKSPNQPPNNWLSIFGRSAWKFDSRTNQYYYHMFYPEQPDLNWRNPEVVAAMHDVLRFWFDKGVAGFRLDAVDTMFEDPRMRDNPVLKGTNQFGDPNQDQSAQRLPAEMHEALRGVRKVADPYGAVLVGETWTSDIASLNEFYGKNQDELQLPMNFLLTTVNRLDAPRLRKEIAAANAAAGWPTYVMGNHDMARSVERYTPQGASKNQVAKLLATLMMTLRGTPIMYYGEEIAMVNNDPGRVEDVLDPIGKLGWPENKGRDGERTPMQWNSAGNAGFSEAKPWLPVHADYRTHNVAEQNRDPDSVLRFYKRLIALRRTNQSLHEGNFALVNENDPNVLAFVREYKGRKVLVALNMTANPQAVSFEAWRKANTLLRSIKPAQKQAGLSPLTLAPFESFVGEVQ